MITPEDVKQSLLTLLKETFEGGTRPEGTIYLDRGVGLFTTIDQLTAEQASRQVTPASTTIAAQVHHSLFYLEVLERFMQGDTERADWRESWQRQQVDAAAWDELRHKLKVTYERISRYLQTQEDWEDGLEEGYSMVIHSAYHLGAVRQMLKLKS
jgi:hypothetical protein